jgi:hypothetical protein
LAAVELPAVFVNRKSPVAIGPRAAFRRNRSSRAWFISFACVLDTRALLVDLLRARQPIAPPVFTLPQ